jgi:hypothetical protein
MLIETTSAKLGLETIRCVPSLVLYMSSTNWSFPSPISIRIARKYPSRTGSVRSSVIRWSLSGTMLRRAIRLNRAGPEREGGVQRSTSAVPSQLFPTKTTGVVAGALGASSAGAGAIITALRAQTDAASKAAVAAPPLFDRGKAHRLRTSAPPVTGRHRTQK